MKYFLILFTILTYSNNMISQSTTYEIDYSYENIDTNSCNIFAQPLTVDNFVHRTNFGRPKFSDYSVVLDNENISVSNSGLTGYGVPFNFKSGYNYKISVFYKGTRLNSTQSYPSIGIRISNNNGGIDSGVNCPSSLSNVSLSSIGAYQQEVSGQNYAWKNNLIDVTLSQNNSHLLIAGFPWFSSGTRASIYVRKIQIIETPPPPAFSISPSSLSITCGSTLPIQKFKINNVNNTPGVTAYNWNLGTTPNGWLYNGTAAPQNITTTVDSIKLTPICGAIQKV
jgi:hypothetical protein